MSQNIQVQCPICLQFASISAAHRNSLIQCPTCEETFRVPDQPTAPAVNAQIVPEPASAPPPIQQPTMAPPVQNPLGNSPKINPSTGRPFKKKPDGPSRRDQWSGNKKKKGGKNWDPLEPDQALMYRIGLFMVFGGCAACLAPVMGEVETRKAIIRFIAQVGPFAGMFIAFGGVGMIIHATHEKVYGLPVGGIGFLATVICALIGFFGDRQFDENGVQVAGKRPEFKKVEGMPGVRVPIIPKKETPPPQPVFNSKGDLNIPDDMPDWVKDEMKEANRRVQKAVRDAQRPTNTPFRTITRPQDNFDDEEGDSTDPFSKVAPQSEPASSIPPTEEDDNEDPFKRVGQTETPRSALTDSSSTATAPVSNRQYAVDEDVEVLWGATWSPARIVSKQANGDYVVHFKDYSDAFDQPTSPAKIRPR